MEIKILGPGCTKCKSLYKNVLEAVKDLNLDANVIKIEDIEEMIKYEILSSPAMVIDGKVKIRGRVPDVNEIKTFLTSQ